MTDDASDTTTPRPTATETVVRRARLEEVQPLAAAYRRESQRAQQRMEPPLPSGAVFWIAEPADAHAGPNAVGYAAGTLRPEGLVLGPVYVEPAHRRAGVASKLLADIERWAASASIPLVEVSVAADNAAGVAFLEGAGFRTRRLLLAREADADTAPRRARAASPR